MITSQQTTASHFSVEVVLTNHRDVVLAKDGRLDSSRVRRVTVQGDVNSGTMHLVIPAKIAQQLGLEISSTAKVTYADGRTAERPVARAVQLACAGRDGIFKAILEPDRESALIGAIVMEDLDLIIDCNRQRLVPRDPDHFISEIE